ncbi:MAG: glycosyltransferase [Chloroflexota bacterium]
MSTIVDIALRYDLDIINEQYQAAAYNMNSPAPNFLPWRMKSVLPVVVTFHDLRPPYLMPKAGSMRERAVQFMAQHARGVIATNSADFETLQSWSVTSTREIPIGSNIEVYQPNHIEIQEVRDQLALTEGDILLGYFGFLNESKGADTLIESLSRLDERYHLVFIGGQTGDSDQANNQEFLDHLRTGITQAGLDDRVRWTGFLPPMRVSAYLGAADLMVMPYRDGVSLRRGTLMAALAHGRPVISTQSADSTLPLQHGANIWLVPPNDPTALSEAIAHLAVDPDLRSKLGDNAAALSEQFSWETIARQTAEYFGELVTDFRLHR